MADLQVVNPFQINLVGHKEGFTTLAVWDSRGQYVERQVRVDPFGRQQVMLNVIVSELNRSRMQAQGINWSFSMPRLGLSVLGLPNNLSTINQGEPPSSAGSLIPLLLSTNVNYAVAAGNSNYQTLSFFQFLETHDLAKILAEPKLMANSGEKAEFLSGGEIPIEERSADEVTLIHGRDQHGHIVSVRITDSPASNPAFDVTPARLVTGYITEKGITASDGLLR